MTKNWSTLISCWECSTFYKYPLPVYRFIPQLIYPQLSSAFPTSYLLRNLHYSSCSILQALLSYFCYCKFLLCISLGAQLSLLVHFLFANLTRSDGSGTRFSERQRDEAKEGSAKARSSEGGHSQVRDAGHGFHGALWCALYVISTNHIVVLQQQLRCGIHARMRDPKLNNRRSACTTAKAILMRPLFERQVYFVTNSKGRVMHL